jgi:ParB-like nuclease family protein
MSAGSAGIGKGASTETQVAIKWGDIAIPDGLNARSDLPEVQRLAESLKARGQLSPIIVTNGGGTGAGEKPYTLIGGARRMAAYKLLGWEKREILAVVRTYSQDDPLGPVLDNWTENEEREGFSTLDRAERISQLKSGTYYVPAGLTPVPLDDDTIAAKFGKTKRTIQKLYKVHRDVDHDVALKARKVDAPEWLIIRLSQIEGEGETKEAKEESRATQQMAFLVEWHEHKLALEGAGRQRAERSDKGGKKGKKKRGKGTGADDNANGWGAIDPGRLLDKKERTADDYYTLLQKKSMAKLPKEESGKVEGALLMMNFLAGGRKTLPFISEQDWAEYMPPPAEDDDEEEPEET